VLAGRLVQAEGYVGTQSRPLDGAPLLRPRQFSSRDRRHLRSFSETTSGTASQAITALGRWDWSDSASKAEGRSVSSATDE